MLYVTVTDVKPIEFNQLVEVECWRLFDEFSSVQYQP